MCKHLSHRSLHMYNASHEDPLASPQRVRLRGSKLDPMDMKVFEPSRQLPGGNETRFENFPPFLKFVSQLCHKIYDIILIFLLMKLNDLL